MQWYIPVRQTCSFEGGWARKEGRLVVSVLSYQFSFHPSAPLAAEQQKYHQSQTLLNWFSKCGGISIIWKPVKMQINGCHPIRPTESNSQDGAQPSINFLFNPHPGTFSFSLLLERGGEGKGERETSMRERRINCLTPVAKIGDLSSRPDGDHRSLGRVFMRPHLDPDRESNPQPGLVP